MTWDDITFSWMIRNIYFYLVLAGVVASIIINKYYTIVPGLYEISLTSGILKIVFGAATVIFSILLLISMVQKGRE